MFAHNVDKQIAFSAPQLVADFVVSVSDLAAEIIIMYLQFFI